MLLKKIDKLDLTESKFIEFREHLKRDTDLLRPFLSKESQQNENLTAKKSFIIHAWDKTRSDTFDLGTQVGCCLAPDGGQFQAMVQRRMDDGMFMHVVSDVSNPLDPRAVSLAWLYFGADKANPKDIYVVANFFEIKSSLASDSNLRDLIVSQLQEYISQFADTVGAKGFLMNHLTYGLIPNFSGFEKKQISLEKVGGFLCLANGQHDYYLNSLTRSEFHLFKSRIPKNSNSATQAPLLHRGTSQNSAQAEDEPEAAQNVIGPMILKK